MTQQSILRKELLGRRNQLTLNEQKKASANITEQLIVHPFFLQNQIIAGYISINYEIDPAMIIKQAWQQHKRCYLPVIREKQLIFCHYQSSTFLKRNYYNIPEPTTANDAISPFDLDLVLIPLVGFTDKGQRLGMGAGFYDRSFSFLLKSPRATRPFLLGLAYEWQKVEPFTENSWDVPLNAVITEKRIYIFR